MIKKYSHYLSRQLVEARGWWSKPQLCHPSDQPKVMLTILRVSDVNAGAIQIAHHYLTAGLGQVPCPCMRYCSMQHSACMSSHSVITSSREDASAAGIHTASSVSRSRQSQDQVINVTLRIASITPVVVTGDVPLLSHANPCFLPFAPFICRSTNQPASLIIHNLHRRPPLVRCVHMLPIACCRSPMAHRAKSSGVHRARSGVQLFCRCCIMCTLRAASDVKHRSVSIVPQEESASAAFSSN